MKRTLGPALLLCAGFVATSAHGGEAKPALTGKEIFQKVLRSAVWIVYAEADPLSGAAGLMMGSGSVIDVQQKLVLTNGHVVGNHNAVAVFFPQHDKNRKLIAAREHYLKQLQSEPKNVVRGNVIFRDSKRDLALLKLPSLPVDVSAVPFARESASPGDAVHSIGNPGASGALWAYSPGSVKAVYPKKWRVMDPTERRILQFEATVVETTSPVNPGDSGGPLVNGDAELVGVTQGGLTSMGTISYFIDISEVRHILAAAKIRITSSPTTFTSAGSRSDDAGDKESAVAESQRTEAAAQSKLNVAELYRDRPSKYKEKLEEVIKLYPDTKAAKQAKESLAHLK